ncbi:ABC-F family ATP-binding cassette domain-containing protein [Mesoterricola sediminis]|uniref:ABC transporter ATP-binding protein n=1 Tax=Mesoterricola sediminis TaxID=2927980 RepID=A0AA48GUC2_9BACT|nr:ABC-F family ATP-binding cassette domain-containing protein [Mesoterricola sediminis]BDU76379.1 ABC transporter ATP-binding protein [Mesoterricola sediminis]
MLASLNHAFLSFGPHEVLKDVTWSIQEDACWGVIGRNGAGKSTVFKVLLGQLELDKGTVVRPTAERGIRMGHYAQDLEPATDGSILEEALAAFGDVEALQHEMRDLEHRMGEPGADLEAIMARYQAVQEAFERLDGFTIRARAEGILFALGFGPDLLEKNVHELSGGQKSRVMLAKAILQGQDLLLLDEPTNHLDLPSLRWLESFINGTSATVAVISHDRYFLDRIATSILEIELGRSRVYEGNYTDFIEKKEQELEIAERHFERQQEYIKRQEEYIRRNIAGQDTKQARGRRTHLAKLQRLEKPLRDRRRIKFTFAETQRSGDTALVLDKASVGWDGTPLFEPLDHFQVKRGQKLAIVGLNGTGKSTLLKAIAGEIPYLTGGSRLGSQVKLGYFDQHHRNLDPRNTVFQQIQAVIPLAPKQDVLGFLAKFQFRGDDVDKPVTVLSGGERARLSVATLIREGVNLLLLDEPTNHMDIHSMEAMEDTILSFTGAVVLVTHDRYLLGRVADSILRVHEGRAEFKEGGYEDNQAWVDLDIDQDVEAPAEPEEAPQRRKAEPKPKAADKAPAPPAKPQPIDRERQKTLRRWERKVQEAEAQVADLEGRLAVLAQELAVTDPAQWETFSAKLDAQKQLETELAYAMSEWEQAQTALEEASK